MSDQASAGLQNAVLGMVTDPRANPMQRAAALAQAPQQAPPTGAGIGSTPPMTPPAAPPGVDAIRTGAAMAAMQGGPPARAEMRLAVGGAVRAPRGYADGGAVDDDTPDMSTMGGSLGSWDPRLVAAIKQMMTDQGPSKEDKGLALAQAGFGMAASQSPHFLGALGEGGVYGLKALQDAKKERALQSMKAAALAGSIGTAQDKVAAQREAIAERLQAAKIAAQSHTDVANMLGSQKAQAAQALAQQRYQSNAAARDKNYYATGVWRDLPEDAANGITGKPVPQDRPAMPQVMDPMTPPKVAQALDQAHPKAFHALQTTADNTQRAIDLIDKLETHPGLESGTGTMGTLMSHVPLVTTDAKNFNIMKHSLQAQVRMGVMQQLKDMSPSGASGFGRVTNMEFGNLGDSLASLDSAQDTPQLKAAFENVRGSLKKALANTRDAYTETYGETYKGKSVPKLPWESAAAAANSAVDITKIPDAAKEMLKNSPDTAAQFDAQFGAGAAQSVLGTK